MILTWILCSAVAGAIAIASADIPAWATDFCSYGKRKDGGQDE